MSGRQYRTRKGETDEVSSGMAPASSLTSFRAIAGGGEGCGGAARWRSGLSPGRTKLGEVGEHWPEYWRGESRPAGSDLQRWPLSI